MENEAQELEIGADLRSYDRLDLETMVKLARKGVKSLEDLADLAADELKELVPDAPFSLEEAGNIIMDARVALGWIEREPEPEDVVEQPETEATA
jgi:transcription termination/antitermination protein NusA